MDEGRTHYVGDGCPGGHADDARAAGIARTTGDTVTALDRLRTIAEQASPGPWAHQPPPQDGTIHRIRKVDDHGLPFFVARAEDTGYSERSSFRQRAADAEHIATFDPPTVLALLDVAEAAAPLVNHVGKSQDGEWDAAEERLSDALDRLREVSS